MLDVATAPSKRPASSMKVSWWLLVRTAKKNLVGALFRVVKSQAADHEIDDFMTVPRSRPA
jgi:hypothetical protein